MSTPVTAVTEVESAIRVLRDAIAHQTIDCTLHSDWDCVRRVIEMRVTNGLDPIVGPEQIPQIVEVVTFREMPIEVIVERVIEIDRPVRIPHEFTPKESRLLAAFRRADPITQRTVLELVEDLTTERTTQEIA